MLFINNFNKYFDHTILKSDATYQQIDKVCEEAIEYDFYSVCVNTAVLDRVSTKLKNTSVLPICVVGFPLGANHIDVKVYETKFAVDHGAKEIDMVINVGAFLTNDINYVIKDIKGVINASQNIPVKVIIETCYLSPLQIQEITKICAYEGAAFIKTSTGFGTRGVSVEDIINIRSTLNEIKMSDKVKIKASGGIKNLDFCIKLIEEGVHRIGSSSSKQILDQYKQQYK